MILAARPGLAPVNQIGSGLPTGVLQHLRDDERESLRQEQTQNSTIQFPQPILPSIPARQLPPPRRRFLGRRLVVRKEAIDDEGIDGDDDDGEGQRDQESLLDGNALLNGIGILQANVP